MNRITGPNPSREPTPEEIKQANAIFNVIISIVVIAVIIIGIVWAITNRNSPNSDTVAVASPTVEPTESDEPETPEPSPSSTPVQNTLVVCNDADETAYVAISFEGSELEPMRPKVGGQSPLASARRRSGRTQDYSIMPTRPAENNGTVHKPTACNTQSLMPSETPQTARVTLMLI